MDVGDIVGWDNHSYIVNTQASGEIVAIHDDHVVVRRDDIISTLPHMNPFVVKRLWELSLVEQQVVECSLT